MYLGMRPAEAPYVFASKIFTALYFLYFLAYVPFLNWLTRQLLDATLKTPTDASIAPANSPL